MTDDAPLDPSERDALVAAAWAMLPRARCGYSKFAVGAALRDEQGRVWTGANVENASYTLGLCAERVAIFHALTHGAGRFTHVVVATDTAQPTSPCGACRQILWEFARDAMVVMVARDGAQTQRSVAELLPGAFDDGALSG
ncbi:MAG: cytidine deaminase [Nannocystaceae bacterium]|nr:cytidine deaminase [Nannocystaceae bacterium]